MLNWRMIGSSFLLLCFVSSACAQPQSPEYTILADVVYGHKHGMALTYDVIQAKEPNGAGVAFMVSGGWVSRWQPPKQVAQFPLLKSVLDEGYTLFLVRHSSSPMFKVPDAVEDVRRAIRSIRQNADKYNIDANRLGAMGASAGGHLSLMLGTTAENDHSRVAAVAALFPPTDLRGMVGPSKSFPALDFDTSKADAVSPILHITDDDAPTLLVHGTVDRLVPLSHSRNLKAEFEKTKAICKLVEIDGAGHGFRGDAQKTACNDIIAWFNEHLKAKSKQ